MIYKFEIQFKLLKIYNKIKCIIFTNQMNLKIKILKIKYIY